jgi:hypothetical protein
LNQLEEQDSSNKCSKQFFAQKNFDWASLLQKGTMVTVEGPRFSTKAESHMFRMWGADVINMTTVPEVTGADAFCNPLHIPPKNRKKSEMIFSLLSIAQLSLYCDIQIMNTYIHHFVIYLQHFSSFAQPQSNYPSPCRDSI